MENLPDDVLKSIFIRLLAKQLAQMRSVCKPWNALLSESSFIKSHLHQSTNNKDDKIILFFGKGFSYRSTPGPLSARPTCSPHLEHTNFMKKLELPINPQHKSGDFVYFIIGSENGLICFAYSPFKEKPSIHFWNPSLSALLTLPPSLFPHKGSPLEFGFGMGFGFDPKTDDYKVVKLPNIEIQAQGEVYSMRKGSWDLITHTLPSHIKELMYCNEVCVNGRLHWLCVIDVEGNKQLETILAFDLGEMTFSEIPFPDSILLHNNIDHINELGVLGGKLCLMSCMGDVEYCHVWVMDDDATWVKHHAFPQFSARIVPHGFTSQKEFLLQVPYSSRFALYGSPFALYDPVAAKTKIFKVEWSLKFGVGVGVFCGGYKIFEYVDSLVWITPSNRLQI